jgi:hypothetical protein
MPAKIGFGENQAMSTIGSLKLTKNKFRVKAIAKIPVELDLATNKGHQN